MRGSFDARLERLKQHLLDRFNRMIFDAPYSVDGYTSRAQADDLGAVLDLTAGDRLLDVGAGDGWPGAYLADRSGCAVVTTDLGVDGLRRAPRRPVVAASGRHLPFAAGRFEAVVHADVLCWLRPKLSVLRACRRVLRSGGRTGYFLIHPAPDLSTADHRRALRLGPPVVTLDGRTVSELTTRAGFVDVVVTDLSDEFRDALASKRRVATEVDGELRQRFGEDVVDHLDRDRVDTITAVEDGVLRRSRVVAIAA